MAPLLLFFFFKFNSLRIKFKTSNVNFYTSYLNNNFLNLVECVRRVVNICDIMINRLFILLALHNLFTGPIES